MSAFLRGFGTAFVIWVMVVTMTVVTPFIILAIVIDYLASRLISLKNPATFKMLIVMWKDVIDFEL